MHTVSRRYRRVRSVARVFLYGADFVFLLAGAAAPGCKLRGYQSIGTGKRQKQDIRQGRGYRLARAVLHGTRWRQVWASWLGGSIYGCYVQMFRHCLRIWPYYKKYIFSRKAFSLLDFLTKCEQHYIMAYRVRIYDPRIFYGRRCFVKKSYIFGFLFFLFLFTGCMFLPVEEAAPPPPIAPMPQARLLRTAPVGRGDVIRSTNVTAVYVPAREERLFFTMADVRVEGVFVNTGDYVQEGDLIAALYLPHIQHQLADALRQEEWILLSLSQVRTRHNRALYEAGVTGSPVDDEQFRTEINQLTFELELLRRRLDYLQAENETRYVWAGMNGVITDVMVFTEGMLSVTNRAVAVIADQAHTIFEIRATEPAALMHVGNVFDLYINQVPFPAEVIDPEVYGVDRANTQGHEVYLTFVGDGPLIIGRPIAWVYMELEAVRDVIYVPTVAINFINERTLVYVLDERGIRVARDVEIGMRGNFTTEIISGLTEGEAVVL